MNKDILVDFHSHVLPDLDDGASNIDESLRMLRSLYRQGVRYVVATPHFYPFNESPDDFLNRRKASYESLQNSLYGIEHPEIILGAEVLYFDGICNAKEIRNLAIKNTDYIMIEMPFTRWDSRTVQNILNIKSNLNLNVIIAHFERYIKLQKRSTIKTLLDADILFQFNAGFVIRHTNNAIKYLKSGWVSLIGSDCHNMNERRPNISDALKCIDGKISVDLIGKINKISTQILSVSN